MSIRQRNNVKAWGNGPTTLLFAHGFGCDQSMWRFLLPALDGRYRIVVFDAVGSGASDWRAYDRVKYGSLLGYAQDVLEIADEFAEGFADRPLVFVGHSVGAMVGLLATILQPGRFAAQVMVSPSPCYLNDGDYRGGFSLEDIGDLLQTLADNYVGWARTMAPVIMGAPAHPELGKELADSFCRADPAIAAHFAHVTFLSDHRADLPRSATPALILQCTDDLLAPRAVGEFTHRALAGSELCLIDNTGHCPHMSAPRACAAAIADFLPRLAG
ncbi:alpha/beta fold hydrolase [Pseudoduganella umbonata]|uniref:Alpha/beta hydrolase n=1 Tax=Pseudoduganella umbonata TaxID=864828 RepID=A0A4P8HKW1_9BURK|nr:alpha/beta hydrolase [Pseudoduganella umbonata]MBB3221120.1 sigma-B regulation protein RsbQ [Pseudoduganella umbonata]QCP10313.1 alpha/beta hydrolase [Pseudoduganella umbonata]